MKLDTYTKECLKSKLKDMVYWYPILYYFKEHQDELNWFQMFLLYRKAEKFRHYWNVERKKKITIMKNGKPEKTTTTTVSLKTRRRDINPQDIYRISNTLKWFSILTSPHLITLKIRDDFQNNS